MLRVRLVSANTDKIVFADIGQSLIDLLLTSQVLCNKYLCLGTGLCGKCSVQFISNAPKPLESDYFVFSESEIKHGWRLACRHVLNESCEIQLSDNFFTNFKSYPGNVLVVDIGTTHIKWSIHDDKLNNDVRKISNPQLLVGSDVMSRISYSINSKDAYNNIRASLLNILQKIIESANSKIIGIAGNAAMIEILMNCDLRGLAFYPYSLSYSGGRYEKIIQDYPDIYIPPLLGAFIGADVSAGLAYIEFNSPVYPYLYIDVGTNAEFVLALNDQNFVACSVPMGPAIEGASLSCGSIFGDNVLSDFDDFVCQLFHNIDIKCDGISGTGFIALIALLYRNGLINVDGNFVKSCSPLAKRMGSSRAVSDNENRFYLNKKIYISEKDTEEILKVKAGFNVAISTLLSKHAVSFLELSQIYIAGAFGVNVDSRDLLEIGFLPSGVQDKVLCIHESVLKGLYLAVTDSSVREWLALLASKVLIIDIVHEEGFNKDYIQAIRVGWV